MKDSQAGNFPALCIEGETALAVFQSPYQSALETSGLCRPALLATHLSPVTEIT